MKRVPLRRVNPARRRRRQAIAFGSKAAWIRGMPCAVCGQGPTQAAHVRSRGAGGTAVDLVPLCMACHTAQHTEGIGTFAFRCDVDLAQIARDLETRWKEDLA